MTASKDDREAQLRARLGEKQREEETQAAQEINDTLSGRTIDRTEIRRRRGGDWEITYATHLSHYREGVPDKALVTVGFNELGMWLQSVIEDHEHP